MAADAVTLLKTIADETRLKILGLVASEPKTGAELAEALKLSAPTISHHMKRLSEVGIVTVTPDGNRRLYRLNSELLRSVGADGPQAPALDDPYQAKVVRTFFINGRLTAIPAKRRARVAVLVELLRRFEAGRDYTEPEVNDLLRPAHDDVAFLRRELVDYRYLTRSGGIYRVVDAPPERDANERQEVPSGESAWLGALIRSSLNATAPGA